MKTKNRMEALNPINPIPMAIVGGAAYVARVQRQAEAHGRNVQGRHSTQRLRAGGRF
jgi:hypothetical protein